MLQLVISLSAGDQMQIIATTRHWCRDSRVYTTVILVIAPFQFFSTHSFALSAALPFYVSPYSQVHPWTHVINLCGSHAVSLTWHRKYPVYHLISSLTVRRGKMATAVPSRFAVLSIEDDDFKPKKTQKSTTTNKNNNAKNKNDKPKQQQQQQQQQQANKKKQNKVCTSIVVALFLINRRNVGSGKTSFKKPFPES